VKNWIGIVEVEVVVEVVVELIIEAGDEFTVEFDGNDFSIGFLDSVIILSLITGSF